MVNEFCGFRHGVIGKDLPADTTLNNMKKVDLIKLLHTAQHNYESLMWFYNNAVKANMSQLNNNGWIPCEKEMPPQPKENPLFENKPLELYLVTLKNQEYPFRAFWNGKFFTDGWGKVDATAWQPLPQPYQPKGE